MKEVIEFLTKQKPEESGIRYIHVILTRNFSKLQLKILDFFNNTYEDYSSWIEINSILLCYSFVPWMSKVWNRGFSTATGRQ